ncbi:hypothetical protein QE152_g41047, partial [Popillia japonica]
STLQNELRELKEECKVNDFSNVDKDTPDVFMMEKIVQEVAEREKRRNNLIIFNVPELEGGSKTDQVAADTASVADILKIVDISLERVSPTRLETWLSPDIRDSEVLDDRFYVLRKDRSCETILRKTGGGVLIPANNTYKY